MIMPGNEILSITYSPGTFRFADYTFSSERCMECSFLPICRGGCPKQRMKCETEDQFNQLCCVEILNDQEILKKVLLKRINGN